MCYLKILPPPPPSPSGTLAGKQVITQTHAWFPARYLHSRRGERCVYVCVFAYADAVIAGIPFILPEVPTGIQLALGDWIALGV